MQAQMALVWPHFEKGPLLEAAALLKICLQQQTLPPLQLRMLLQEWLGASYALKQQVLIETHGGMLDCAR